MSSQSVLRSLAAAAIAVAERRRDPNAFVLQMESAYFFQLDAAIRAGELSSALSAPLIDLYARLSSGKDPVSAAAEFMDRISSDPACQVEAPLETMTWVLQTVLSHPSLNLEAIAQLKGLPWEALEGMVPSDDWKAIQDVFRDLRLAIHEREEGLTFPDSEYQELKETLLDLLSRLESCVRMSERAE